MLNLEPKEVFKWFQEINQIPRESGNEKEVSDYLVKFAKERNLEVYQDEALNVIIKKPASKGYENSEVVIIQGHMDMVCVKTENSSHNFETDPIEMFVDGDFLRAKDTTLGADDGIAVAFGLAILDGEYNHPAIEFLVTTNEETGMDGAMAIKAENFKGKKLINIDSEEDGIFLVSCAGGNTIETEFPIVREALEEKGIKIVVKGLKGGHSGGEIHKQRANANKVMARVLNSVRDLDLKIGSITGGIKHNAIPNICKSEIYVNNLEITKIKIEELLCKIKEEYRVEEKDFNFEIEEIELKSVYSRELSEDIIDYIMLTPDGVQSMSKDIDGLVETSLNTAVIEEDNGKIKITSALRSSSESQLDDLTYRLKLLAKRCNAIANEDARYPSWEFEKNSPLREIALKTFKEVTGVDATYNAIHAGLECGFFKKVMPDVDMISFGPDILDAHSPKERISISSTEKNFKFFVKLLENLK